MTPSNDDRDRQCLLAFEFSAKAGLPED